MTASHLFLQLKNLLVQAAANESGTIKVAAEDTPSFTSSTQSKAGPPANIHTQDRRDTLPLPPSIQALRPDIGGTVASDPRNARLLKSRVAIKDRMATHSQRQTPEGHGAPSQASAAFKEAANNRKQLPLIFFPSCSNKTFHLLLR